VGMDFFWNHTIFGQNNQLFKSRECKQAFQGDVNNSLPKFHL